MRFLLVVEVRKPFSYCRNGRFLEPPSNIGPGTDPSCPSRVEYQMEVRKVSRAKGVVLKTRPP